MHINFKFRLVILLFILLSGCASIFEKVTRGERPVIWRLSAGVPGRAGDLRYARSEDRALARIHPRASGVPQPCLSIVDLGRAADIGVGAGSPGSPAGRD